MALNYSAATTSLERINQDGDDAGGKGHRRDQQRRSLEQRGDSITLLEQLLAALLHHLGTVRVDRDIEDRCVETCVCACVYTCAYGQEGRRAGMRLRVRIDRG